MRPRRPVLRRNNNAISVPLRSPPLGGFTVGSSRAALPSLPRPRVLVTREYDEEDQNEDQPDEDEDEEDLENLDPEDLLEDEDPEEDPDPEDAEEEDTQPEDPQPQEHAAATAPITIPATATTPAMTVCEEIKERAGKCVVCGQLPLESYICPNVHSVCGTCYPCIGDSNRKSCPICRFVNRFIPNFVYNHLVSRFWGREIKQQQLEIAQATTSHAALLAEFRTILGPKNEVFCAPANIPIARAFMLVFLQEYAATEGAKGLPAVAMLKDKLKQAFPAPYCVLDYSVAQEKLWWVYLGHLMTQDQILCIGCIKQHLYVISRRAHNSLE